MTQHRFARYLSVAAAACICLGLSLTGFFVLAQVDQRIGSASALDAFERARSAALASSPDQSLWSSGRKQGFEDSLAVELGAPAGVLKLPTIDLTAPIFEGTDELTLNRGVGWIEGTSQLGGNGNIGLAGHRDGFFRGLKDIAVGDGMELETIHGTRRYRVSELLIVEPEDVYVLDPTATATVTLVTCYPFYFVGHAPQRFIVRGVADETPDLQRSATHGNTEELNQ